RVCVIYPTAPAFFPLSLHDALPISAWTRDNPLAAGMPARTLCARLGLPRTLLGDLLRASELHSSGGLIRRTDEHALPPWVERAVREIVGALRSETFPAPEADRLAALGLRQGVSA